MFGPKKTSRSSSGQKKHDLGMFGLDINLDGNAGFGVDENEDDLEAELAALQGGRPPQKRVKAKKGPVDLSAIDAIASECMNDESFVDDEDYDENELLAELEGLAPMDSNTSLDNTPTLIPAKVSSVAVPEKTHGDNVSVITERKTMYETAIANAEKAGDGGKARRFKRGLKEIEKMLKSAKSGNAVNMDELPPLVATGGAKPNETSTASQPSVSTDIPTQASGVNNIQPVITNTPQKPNSNTSQTPVVAPKPVPRTPPVIPKPHLSEDNEKVDKIVKGLQLKRDQYKLAARDCNRNDDKEKAKTYLRISKEFDIVIQAVKDGKEVDLSQCPPPPPGFRGGGSTTQPKYSQESSSTSISSVQTPTSSDDNASDSTPDPPPPKTILEGLEQRLAKYQSGVTDAEKEGNSGKARRMKRIVKQYQDAIRDHKAKKPVDLNALPTPPGYAAFPVDAPPVPTEASTRPAANPSKQEQPAVARQAAVNPPVLNVKAAPKGRNEKELQFLLDRQKQFKMAALEAKKRGDLEQARNHLRSSKGFDGMIEAARNGLRVDLSKVPESPTLGASLAETISAKGNPTVVEDRTPDSGSRDEIFGSLEKALKSQYEMCKKNSKHYSTLGDIENSKRFEKLALNCKKDYESLQSAFKHGNPPPRYHYENRTFNIIRSHTDLGDQDCELEIIKCINIPLPSGYSKDDMKVCVAYEFPFPNDEPQVGCTETVKHTINPEFHQNFKLSIDRKNRALGRIFRRHSVKFEVKYNRGFLKGDKCLAQATVKLASFDNRCEIHECVDLMDPDRGRKAIGGKIEVKLRMREPLTDKDVEILTEKWLVIDAFVAPTNRPISATSTNKFDERNKPRNPNMSRVCTIE